MIKETIQVPISKTTRFFKFKKYQNLNNQSEPQFTQKEVRKSVTRYWLSGIWNQFGYSRGSEAYAAERVVLGTNFGSEAEAEIYLLNIMNRIANYSRLQ